MSTFNDCLAHQKANAVYIRRNAACLDLQNAVSQVSQLDRENPKVRLFVNYEKEIDVIIQKIKTENNMMIQLMLSAQSNIAADQTFNSDQEVIRSGTLAALNALDEYRTLLESKGLVQTLQQQQQRNQEAATTEI